MVLLQQVLTASSIVLLFVLWRRKRLSLLSRYPDFLPGSSLSDVPYVLLDALSSVGPTPYLAAKHARLGPTIRTGPQRLHLAQASPGLLRALGRCDKAPSYAGFDIGGHATLFSERTRERHSARGKLAPHFFSSANAELREKVLHRNAQRICEHIEARLAASEREGGGDGSGGGGSEGKGEVKINLLGVFRAYAVDTASELLFGRAYGAIDELGQQRAAGAQLEQPSIGRVNDHFNAAVPLALWIGPLARAVSTLRAYMPSIQKLSADELASLEEFDRYVDAVIDQKSNEGPLDVEGPQTDYVSSLAASQLYRSLSRTEQKAALVAETCDVLFAATESLATTLAVGLCHIARLFGTGQKRSDDEEESSSSLGTLLGDAYLRAVVDECLRIASPVPRALDRIIGPRGLVLDDGALLAPGTIVGVSPECFHRQPRETFRPGDTTSTFDPERWLDDGQNASHIAFGLPGHRACIAKNLAMAELSMMISAFCRNFTILPGLETRIEPRDFWNKGFKNGMVNAVVGRNK
ncbi:cytochrome P450 [Acaromyces ingoldii]|uniref:Cytochrome P450 n=1 Tax=Acaromyces ingoldii TaxID=215250 RepID=A0A316YQK8_9BASI|nr:cytochrome P450 [Acaromyces ingoldii]PWN91412.1 cytochrome P450 [Acaromyces ingoldii]